MREFNRVEAIGSIYEKDYYNKQISQIKRSNLLLEIGSQDSKLVDIICYCLNSNHFHFLLKQNLENGISKFMHKLGLGYTLYFNQRYNRSGSLFQGKYKSIHIKTDDNLLRLSSYVNGNLEVHGICQAEKWQWGSYQDYLGIRQGDMCSKEDILEQFENIKEYGDYTDYIIADSRQLKLELKNYYLE
ncbi:MAG: transposase [Candidatus Magasanikbacteria bacterium]|nr:transposase [Candidatus Magasanikbacteria bacterium]